MKEEKRIEGWTGLQGTIFCIFHKVLVIREYRYLPLRRGLISGGVLPLNILAPLARQLGLLNKIFLFY